MTRGEFLGLFKRRQVYLVGSPKEAVQTVQILEEIGFKSQTMDHYAFRIGERFHGEIWATASGKNWRFSSPWAAVASQATPIHMCNLPDILSDKQPDDEELTGGDLADIL
nr:MAG TPA: hypothetical protein [Caudoviricetes sp.]